MHEHLVLYTQHCTYTHNFYLTVKYIRDHGGLEHAAILAKDPLTGELLSQDEVNDALGYHSNCDALFWFSYLVDPPDGSSCVRTGSKPTNLDSGSLVPDEMLEHVIFALKMFIRVFEECSDNALRAIGHKIPQDPEKALFRRGIFVSISECIVKVTDRILTSNKNHS